MKSENKGGVNAERQLAEFIASFYADPYGFVMAAFPWGQPTLADGSPNPLKNKKGPEPWQEKFLKDLGKHIKRNVELGELGLDKEPWKSAVGSGHGVGKSACVAWVIYFLMSTRTDTRGTVTASTQFQLEDKTWPELGKWHNLAINKHWFKWTATTFSFASYPEEKQKNYRTTAATVSEHNTEAFQGLHNEGRTVFVVFDEASGVHSKIWEVSEGVMFDGEAFFFAFGNMTKPDGEFVDCFENYSHLYYTMNVDSRDVSFTNKSAIRALIDKHGIESDQVKVRIRGMPPLVGLSGFIDASAVHDAMQRESVVQDSNAALIMAVDVSNRGGDESIIQFRQGWDARSRKAQARTGLKHSQMVEWVANVAMAERPDVIVVECVGIGIPLCDDLEELGFRIFRAYPGGTVENDYVNNRALWWSYLRDWIYEPLSALEENKELYNQLTQIQYRLRKSDGKTLIESKEEMHSRGLPSPDRADGLMLTFAVKVPRRDLTLAARIRRRVRASKTEYEVLEH